MPTPAPTASENTPLPEALIRPRALVIDDEPTVRAVATLMLERGGFVVDEAADGPAALAALRGATRPFDAVLLDVTLPGQSGIELVPVIRVLAPLARIVLASGRAEEDVPDHGADAFLSKPFTRDRLLAALRAPAPARA